MEDNILLISCIFGKKFNKVYERPSLFNNATFFTNNSDLKNEITEKGWKYFYIDFYLSNDEIISSLQSKYVKFLKFLDDYEEFRKFKYILYFDHKCKIENDNIYQLFSISQNNPNSKIIIRETPRNKSIWDEVVEASKHSRYAYNMINTIKFIKNIIIKDKLNDRSRICATGLILYYNYQDIYPMLLSIYNTCMLLKQPECQIIWSLYSQKYKDFITTIPFNLISILHQCPG